MAGAVNRIYTFTNGRNTPKIFLLMMLVNEFEPSIYMKDTSPAVNLPFPDLGRQILGSDVPRSQMT